MDRAFRATSWRFVRHEPSCGIDRSAVARTLATILAQHAVDDVIVEDPPFEEVIAHLFARVDREIREADKRSDPRTSALEVST